MEFIEFWLINTLKRLIIRLTADICRRYHWFARQMTSEKRAQIGCATWEINLIKPIRSTTQIWVVTRRQYGISALVSQTSFGGETSGSVAKCRLFSQTKG